MHNVEIVLLEMVRKVLQINTAGTSMVDRVGKGTGVQANELPEAFDRGEHTRSSKREAAIASHCPSSVL